MDKSTKWHIRWCLFLAVLLFFHKLANGEPSIMLESDIHNYKPLSPGSVEEFFQGVHRGLVIVLPDQAISEEVNSAIWIYGSLRRYLGFVPVALTKAAELYTYDGWSRIFVGKADRSRAAGNSTGGTHLASDTELVVYGGDGEQLKSAARRVTESVRLAAGHANGFSGDSDSFKQREIVRLGAVQASGGAEVQADIDVFSQLLPDPPESLSFHLDGKYTVSEGRAIRLDLYFNGHLIKSELLNNTGQLSKNFSLPEGIGILGRNTLTAILVYPDNGGGFANRSNANRLEVSGASYMVSTGTFSPQQLQWKNVALYFGQPGLVLVGGKLEIESIRAAADFVAWMNAQLPDEILALPELGSFENHPSMDRVGYAVLLGRTAELPAHFREKFPLFPGEKFSTLPTANGGEPGFQLNSESVLGQITVYGKVPLIALTTDGGLGQLVPAIRSISTPYRVSRLAGNTFVFQGPSSMRVFDSHKDISDLQLPYGLLYLSRIWDQYHIWILAGVWLTGMFFLAWIYRKQRRRVMEVVEDRLLQAYSK